MATLHDLFNWAIQHSDGPQTSDTTQKPIDKKWLDAILRSDADKMKALVKVFTSEDTTLIEKEVSLEELEAYLQLLDNANDLNHPTVNGLVPLLEGLKNEHPSIRSRCASALGTAIQNNPKVQLQVLELEGITKLVDCIKGENEKDKDWNVIGKSVYALAGLLDHNQRGQKEFRTCGGFTQLLSILQNVPPKNKISQKGEEEEKEEEIELNDTKEEEKPKPSDDEDANVIVDVEDRVKEEAERRAKILSKKKPIQVDNYLQWIRTSRKIIFLLNKLVVDNEQLKLVFIKDNNGEIITCLLNLLEHNHNDIDLDEKILSALDALTSSENSIMQKYILDHINGNSNLNMKSRLLSISSRYDQDAIVTPTLKRILSKLDK